MLRYQFAGDSANTLRDPARVLLAQVERRSAPARALLVCPIPLFGGSPRASAPAAITVATTTPRAPIPESVLQMRRPESLSPTEG